MFIKYCIEILLDICDNKITVTISIIYIGNGTDSRSILSGVVHGEIGKELVFEAKSDNNPKILKIKYLVSDDPKKEKNKFEGTKLENNEITFTSYNVEKGKPLRLDSLTEIATIKSSSVDNRTDILMVMFEIERNNIGEGYKLTYEFIEKAIPTSKGETQ